ncbi:hypothetical protein GA0070616_0401 [Micromonospora nigra]|uniref:Uncharacterized protein n=1 Tax=Micromonospora nigra TaxID=145857 RepID=A0A1C6RB80_9ACTN|nr:hypothetical protein [Micromonospora nigra]SCL14301.1 hypothetical protein GA0070616_0401 [Micromonospora nigra]
MRIPLLNVEVPSNVVFVVLMVLLLAVAAGLFLVGRTRAGRDDTGSDR